MLKGRLDPSQQKLDSFNQTKFCIDKSKQFIEREKKQQSLNKLSLKYSLSKINKEKMYGRLIPFTAGQYPRLAYESSRYTAHQYSSPRIRENRRSFILAKQMPSPQHKEEIKRYSQLLNKKKQKQGGLDSFWMFKKEVQSSEKKVKDKKAAQMQRTATLGRVNRVQQAFSNIFIWGKLPVDLVSGLISKSLLKNYITTTFGEIFAGWFLNFFQIKSYFNFKEFQKLGEKFSQMSVRQSHLISFMLYDRNGDGFICPRDVFATFQKQMSPTIESDILDIGQFAKNNEGREQQINEQFKIQHVVLQDLNLTAKDYEVCFKKVDEPFLMATNKKDTGFAKTFAVLDHRQKVRSTRRQLNQKKMMYNQLFQQIARDNKNTAFVELQDYRLNYTFLYEIFKNRPTKLFCFFCYKILGVNYVPQIK